MGCIQHGMDPLHWLIILSFASFSLGSLMILKPVLATSHQVFSLLCFCKIAGCSFLNCLKWMTILINPPSPQHTHTHKKKRVKRSTKRKVKQGLDINVSGRNESLTWFPCFMELKQYIYLLIITEKKQREN
jgi:hypothetical protein